MTAELLDRLLRWAHSLPAEEMIPITPFEVCELALYAERLELALYAERLNKDVNHRSLPTLEDWMMIIEKGAFLFSSHRVIVL
jgi:hypothetical protein